MHDHVMHSHTAEHEIKCVEAARRILNLNARCCESCLQRLPPCRNATMPATARVTLACGKARHSKKLQNGQVVWHRPCNLACSLRSLAREAARAARGG